LTVILLVMLVLAGAMGMRKLAGPNSANAGPVLMAGGGAPVPVPMPW